MIKLVGIPLTSVIRNSPKLRCIKLQTFGKTIVLPGEVRPAAVSSPNSLNEFPDIDQLLAVEVKLNLLPMAE